MVLGSRNFVPMIEEICCRAFELFGARWCRFCFETVGILLVLLEFGLFPLIFSVKVIVVRISLLIWVTRFMGRCGCRFYLLTCRRSFIWTVVVCLVIGFLRQLFSFCFHIFFCFFFLFSEGFGLVPLLYLFPFF